MDSTDDPGHPSPPADEAGGIDLGDEDVLERNLGEIASAVGHGALSIPIQNPISLPLAELDPEVFERIIAELVARRNNRGVQFYGRRGQKQYGLDIVEHGLDDTRELYQVKRYKVMTPTELRKAVTEYAGPPRCPDAADPPRRFDPKGFTVVTSAKFDSDTANVEDLLTLKKAYAGDLIIGVWGEEALCRMLRDAPHLVAATCGPQWAEAWCGLRPAPPEADGPRPLGLVEPPVDVLGLVTLRADAVAREAADPLAAADLHRALADRLTEGGFPAHAAASRRRQADMLRAAGANEAAFEVLTEAVLSDLNMRAADIRSLHGDDLEAVAAATGGTATSRYNVLSNIAKWHEQSSRLGSVVRSLDELVRAEDPYIPLLICLVLEQALVDGLFDFSPPNSPFVDHDPSDSELLAHLVELALGMSPVDVALRARLRCACADARLRSNASTAEVEEAFRDVVDDALAGRLHHARGFVLARAGFAFACRGGLERAETLWRQAVICSSEDRYYGDVREALRSAQRTFLDRGVIFPGETQALIAALPDRRRVLQGAYDPALAALKAINGGNVLKAFGDARRYLWECRIGGHWEEWMEANALLAGVLVAAGHSGAAVRLLVASGRFEEAAATASTLGDWIDVRPWLVSPLRRAQAAAVRVTAAQAALVPDQAVLEVATQIADLAAGVWTETWPGPNPNRDAIGCLARFGIRMPVEVFDRVIATATPSLERSVQFDSAMADLVVQAYWTFEQHRAELADIVRGLLRLSDPPHNLWALVEAVPEPGRAELLLVVTELAADGNIRAIKTLASWNVPHPATQVLARMACAALLRNPVGVERYDWTIGTQEGETVDLLMALVAAETHVDVPVERLSRAVAIPAGGTLLRKQVGKQPPGQLDPASPQGDTTGAETAEPGADLNDGPDGSEVNGNVETDAATEPDEAAVVAAGPVGALIEAVARHLAAAAEDGFDDAGARAEAVGALLPLITHLDRDIAKELSERMLALHRNPRLSQFDQFAIASDVPLSRGRMNMGAQRLAPLALVVAAKAHRRAVELSAGTMLEASFADEATAAAIGLLRADDAEFRRLGAEVVTAIAAVGAMSPDLSFGLLFHTDEYVRALGARSSVGLTLPVLETLARDPAPRVRVVATPRADELSEETQRALAADPHLAVRASVSAPLSLKADTAEPLGSGPQTDDPEPP